MPSDHLRGIPAAGSHASADGRSGLQRFGDELDAFTLAELRSWKGNGELGRLVARLEAARDHDQFLNLCAEAIVARHLLRRGCELRVEVLTPAGRTCDFEVTRGGRRFYLHVKRLYTDRPHHRRLTVSSRLRYLERINRPYVVSVRFREALSDVQMQRFVTRAAEFIRHASVGDETVVRDADGREIGGCRILAPFEGPHVHLMIGLPTGFIDESPRMAKLMRKAYQQFMPGETNVILVGSSHVDEAEDFSTALLGSHIERWDTHPPAGQRVAHGRDTDGFWYNGRWPESTAAGWFQSVPRATAFDCRFWIRDGAAPDPAMRRLLQDLFTGMRNGQRPLQSRP